MFAGRGGELLTRRTGPDGRFSIGMPAAPLRPYVLGGLGIANIKQSELEGPSLITSVLNQYIAEDQNKLYFNLGGGVDLTTGPAWSLFAQVRYVSIATEGESSSFIPVTLGLKFF